MAKAILEFDLNDPDDQMAHMRAVKSLDLVLVLWEMLYNTKKSVGWEIESKKMDAESTLEYIYKKFWDEMRERSINLDDLIN